MASERVPDDMAALERGELTFGLTEYGQVYLRMAHVPGMYYGLGDTIREAIDDAVDRGWKPTPFADEEADSPSTSSPPRRPTMSERVELDGLVEALVAFKGAYVTDDVGSVHRLARELIARHILRVIDEGIDRHDARAANARRNHLREKHAHKAAALVSLRARFEGADDEG